MHVRWLAWLWWFSLTRQTWAQTCPLQELEDNHTIEPYYSKMVDKDNYNEGEVVPYLCASGYRQLSPPPGYRNATCRNGHWEYPPNALTCAPVNCGPPGDVPHGYVDGSVFTFPNSVEYKCYDCYAMARKRTHIVYCQSDGNWSPKDRPPCQFVSCGEPSTIDHGRRHGSNFTCGNQVTYACDGSDYTLRGSDTYECSTDGKWTPAGQPVCELIQQTTSTTKQPDVISTIIQQTTSTTKQPDVASISKQPDVTSPSKQPGVTVANKCAKLTPPSNGRLEQNGSLAIFACNDGFEMRGSRVLKCQQGTWVPPDPPSCDSSGEISPLWAVGIGVITAVLVIFTLAVAAWLWRRRPATTTSAQLSEERVPGIPEAHTDGEMEHLQKAYPMTNL